MLEIVPLRQKAFIAEECLELRIGTALFKETGDLFMAVRDYFLDEPQGKLAPQPEFRLVRDIQGFAVRILGGIFIAVGIRPHLRPDGIPSDLSGRDDETRRVLTHRRRIDESEGVEQFVPFYGYPWIFQIGL